MQPTKGRGGGVMVLVIDLNLKFQPKTLMSVYQRQPIGLIGGGDPNTNTTNIQKSRGKLQTHLQILNHDYSLLRSWIVSRLPMNVDHLHTLEDSVNTGLRRQRQTVQSCVLIFILVRNCPCCFCLAHYNRNLKNVWKRTVSYTSNLISKEHTINPHSAELIEELAKPTATTRIHNSWCNPWRYC